MKNLFLDTADYFFLARNSLGLICAMFIGLLFLRRYLINKENAFLILAITNFLWVYSNLYHLIVLIRRLFSIDLLASEVRYMCGLLLYITDPMSLILSLIGSVLLVNTFTKYSILRSKFAPK